METVQEELAELVDDGTKFKLGKFEGPLDLLLFLIKKNEINL